MFTIEPVVAPGGRRREGNSIRWARSPRRIAMPASSFPTVNITLSGDLSDISGNWKRSVGVFDAMSMMQSG